MASTTDLQEATPIPDSTFPINVFHLAHQERLIAVHWHDHLEWIYVHAGMSRIQIDDLFIVAEPGDVIFINSHQIHGGTKMRSAMYRLSTRVLTLVGQLTLFLGASYLLLYKNPTAFRLTAWPPLSPLEVLPSPRILARALRQLVWRYGAHPLWRETVGYIWHTLTFQFGTSLTYPAVPLWHKVLSAMPITWSWS